MAWVEFEPTTTEFRSDALRSNRLSYQAMSSAHCSSARTIYWYAGIQISAVTWIWILLYALRRQKALLRTKDIQHVIFQHLDVLHVPRSAHTYYIYIWLIGNFWHLTLYSRTLTSAISKYINKRWKVSWWERYFGICDQTEKTSYVNKFLIRFWISI